MKTKISNENPFSCGRYSFAFEHIKSGNKYLDYGCYDGTFIYKVLQYKKDIDFIGIDKNKNIVSLNPYNLNLMYFKGLPLPFEDHKFDGITILDVIEHIYDQDVLLRELNRILKMGGEIIVTVPKKYIFSFLDLGNFKFIFPKIHKLFYIIKYSKKEYEERYLNNRFGLIGDIEKEKAWHQHFSNEELQELLEKNGFKVEILDGSNFFGRVFILLDVLKLGFLIPKFIKRLDCLNFESMNLFCKAIKVKEVKNI